MKKKLKITRRHGDAEGGMEGKKLTRRRGGAEQGKEEETWGKARPLGKEYTSLGPKK